jgi:hypothetical protein
MLAGQPRGGFGLAGEPEGACAVALLGERLSAGLAVGGVLILGGIAATWTPGPPDKDPPQHGHSGPQPASSKDKEIQMPALP